MGKSSGTAITTCEENAFFGFATGNAVTTGSYNTFLGSHAGTYGVATTTGIRNICIGTYPHTSAVDSQKQHVMGYNVVGAADSSFTFGDGTTDSSISFGATSITAPSDVRLKEDIQDEKVGLSFINDLRPVTFQWKKAKDIPSDMKAHVADSEERVMNGKYNHGFIAQEVKEVIDNHNLKDGFDMWTEDETDGRQRLGEGALMSVMVKAVQELSAKVEELEDKLNNKE